MPDDFTDDIDEDEDFDDEDGSALVKKLRRQLRSQGKELKEAKTVLEQATAATRDLAFLRAGVDLNDPKTVYFRKGYDGDMDPEAIKQEAIAAGVVTPPPADANVEGHQQANAAAEGADGVQPSENRDAEYEAEMAQAQSQDEILAVMDKYGSPHTDAEFV